MDPLVSVVVPVYNAEKHLRECIESILSQTYGNLEILLVNDGSQDGSLDICRDYEKKDERVSVINQANSGVSAARNAGLRASRGDYIGFVDSDDSIGSRMYQVMLEMIIDQGADLCAQTQYTIRGFDEKPEEAPVMSQYQALQRLLLMKFPTSLWPYLYSRRVVEGLFLNENLHFFEDFEYNVRVLLRCEKIALCEETLYNYRPSEGSVNRQRINERKMSCLDIYGLVRLLIEMDDRHRDLLKYLTYSRAHFLISTVLSLARSTNISEDELRYSPTIQREARDMLLEILISRYVPLAHKLVILAVAACPGSTYRLLSRYTRWKDNSR